MRSTSLLATSLAALLMVGVTTTTAWAGKSGKAKPKAEVMPDNISKQFQWEEKVVGSSDDKKIDHEKIARIQAQARKDEENHRNEPAKKTERAKGIQAPSTSTLPTMDIEKAAPSAAAPRASRPKAVAEARPRDSLDNLLDSEKDTSGLRGSGGSPLDKVLAVSDKPASSSSRDSSSSSSSKGKSSKHAARRGRN